MKPLPWVATGLLVVVLTVDAGGWDVLPDPVGWALVLRGTTALPRDVPLRRAVTGLAGLALAVSLPTSVPQVLGRLRDADLALQWTADLPQLLHVVLLAHALRLAARPAGDRRATTWWSLARTLAGVVAVAPVLVLGAGLDTAAGVAATLAVLTPLLVVALLLTHGSRPWALGPA